MVKVLAPNGRVYVFRHTNAKGVRIGQTVKAGAPIGQVAPWPGGRPHSHLEVWKSLAGGYHASNLLDPAEIYAE